MRLRKRAHDSFAAGRSVRHAAAKPHAEKGRGFAVRTCRDRPRPAQPARPGREPAPREPLPARGDAAGETPGSAHCGLGPHGGAGGQRRPDRLPDLDLERALLQCAAAGLHRHRLGAGALCQGRPVACRAGADHGRPRAAGLHAHRAEPVRLGEAPTAMVYRFETSPYFFIILVLATLAYSWRAILTKWVVVAAIWFLATLGVAFAALPGSATSSIRTRWSGRSASRKSSYSSYSSWCRRSWRLGSSARMRRWHARPRSRQSAPTSRAISRRPWSTSWPLPKATSAPSGRRMWRCCSPTSWALPSSPSARRRRW